MNGFGRCRLRSATDLGLLPALILAWSLELVSLSPARGQCMIWSRRSDVGNPGPQVGHCMAYNPDRRRTTLFTADDRAELWEYDGLQWLRVFINPGPRPSPRVDSAMVYDRDRGELFLMGGFGRSENTELADTWTCRLSTDATGNVVGTWTRRPDFPDFAVPDEDDPSGQRGESGARSEHSLVYDQEFRVVRLFGGKARIVRGSKYHRSYNLRNYSTGRGTWNGSAWVDRRWSNTVPGPSNDPDDPVLPGTMYERVELGRKAIAASYDSGRQRVITYGGLRQIFQHYNDGSAWDTDETDAYVESMPHLQYIDFQSLASAFPSFSRDLLNGVGGHCGSPLSRRVFGAQLVYDTWRDRYVTFGGGYVFGEPKNGVECSPLYNLETSEYTSRLLPQANAFTEWDPQRPSNPDRFFITRIPVHYAGYDFIALPPAVRIRHTMVFDEHRGVTVIYGGWDGFNLAPNGQASETWEYGPNPGAVGFSEEPPALTELCLGDTLTLRATPRNPWKTSADLPLHQQNRFLWFHGQVALTNATNATLVIAEAAPRHAGTYTCRLIDPCGNVSETSPALVRVGGPPVITAQPASINVCPGDTASARFFFQSDYPASIQWFRLAPDRTGDAGLAAMAPLPGTDSNEFGFRSMGPGDSGFYRARVTNRCGSAWTSVIVMTAGVWLRREPSSVTNDVCSAGSLEVRATGKGPLTYQWRRNGEVMKDSDLITGTAGERLAFASIRYLDDAAYDCLVRDACQTVTTRVASITVIPNPPFVLADTNGPSARQRHRFVYDSQRGVSVLFGGLGDGATLADLYRNDTWEYDGTQWTRRNPVDAPSPRVDFGMTFDRHRGRIVLFGGMTNSGFGGAFVNGETWEYDGTHWLRRSPTRSPAPRSRHALFYDPVRRLTTLYGGDTTLPNPRAGDLWTWDGSEWTEQTVSGERPMFGNAGSPPHPRMVWDERRGYAVLPPTSINQGGGQDYATWTWDGTRWTRRPYTFEGIGLTPGMTGSGVGLVYDSFRGEVIYWGGDGFDQTHLWRWNGDRWRRDAIPDLVGYQLHADAVYDERRHSVIWFGGNYTGSDTAARGLSRRTFERLLADTPVLLRQPTVIADPTSNRLFVRVVAAGAPPLSYQWQRDGVKLIEGFPYANTLTDTLVVDRALQSDAGHYRCVVRGSCGAVVSRGITLAGSPEPENLVLALSSGPVAGRTGLSLSWNGSGVLLEQAPHPTGPWTVIQGATSPFTPATIGVSGFFRLRAP